MVGQQQIYKVFNSMALLMLIDQAKVSLSLFTDDKGILRCGGLKNALIPYDVRFSILLPRCS